VERSVTGSSFCPFLKSGCGQSEFTDVSGGFSPRDDYEGCCQGFDNAHGSTPFTAELFSPLWASEKSLSMTKFPSVNLWVGRVAFISSFFFVLAARARLRMISFYTLVLS
jgi:hypothetical protein